MASSLSLHLKQSQSLALSPQLVKLMRLIQMNHLELSQFIAQEIDQLTRLAGVAHGWNDSQECWQPVVDEWQETSAENLMVAGDSGGILGDEAAEMSGRLSILRIVHRLGRISDRLLSKLAAPLQSRIRRLAAARAFTDTIFRTPETMLIPSGDTIVCRCEEVTAMTTILTPELIASFIDIVGSGNALSSPAKTAPYLVESRGLYHGTTPLVLRPGSVEEVSRIMRLASQTRTAIVPQGGNTGHVGGQIPREGKADMVLSLERLNRIRDIDRVGNVIVADAGCILADIKKAADDNGRLFPLSLGSEGSARIGGNLSTNAGGTAVLAYGNMRQLCLGLEVMLPTGEIWDGLRRLKKDNTGYDLRDLFIGAEGTLGVVTGAVLKLLPKPLGHQVAFAGLRSVGDALTLLDRTSCLCGPALTGFELMPRIGVEFTIRHIPGVRDPIPTVHRWYALIDISTSDSAESAERMMPGVLEAGINAGLVENAVIATSEAQRKALWHMRESMSPAQSPEGGSIKHDISVPVTSIPAFIAEADAAVMKAIPGARICAFGHMGDGNIHYNISQPIGADKHAFLDRWREMNVIVHGIVRKYRGSISAEHGIGQLKRDELAEIRPAIEIELMVRIKDAFDPAGIMNPDKVLRSGAV